MTHLDAIKPEECDHLAQAPIVDFLVWDEDERLYVVEFVPEYKIYTPAERSHEKEAVFVDPATPVGQRVVQLLDRLGEVLDLVAPPVRIGHGGGDDFVMYDAQGHATHLPAACDARPETAVQAYAIIHVLGQEAQLEFLDERRRGAVAAAV